MKYSFFLALFLGSVLFSSAQPFGGGRGMQGFGSGQTGRFYGKIVDSLSGKPIDAASVQLVSSQFNMATRQRKDTIINGMLTKANGDFSIENVPMMGDYRLRVTAIGYKTLEKRISFLTPELQKKLMEAFAGMAGGRPAGKPDSTQRKPAAPVNPMDILKQAFGGDMSQMASLTDKDLGNFKMQPDAKELENVTVTGTRPMMQMGIDRRIFNVDRSLAASGSSAVDIMRQIPGINVDIDGNVNIRNNSPTLFVDGRPTNLSLDQIPADDIQSVEIITNPSAKYDASGGTAAILNVVLKKNKRAGYNGSVRAGIDSRPRPNLGGDINIRQGKVNFFVSGNFSQRKSLSWSNIATDYKASGGIPSSAITQAVDNVSNGNFGFGRTGLDFFIDNRNTLTLSMNMMGGGFNNQEGNTITYDTLYTPARSGKILRNTESDRNFRNMGSSLGFKHLFAKPGKELTADINFNRSISDGFSDFSNQRVDGFNNPKGNPALQKTTSGSRSYFIVAQSDYSNKLSDRVKLETGLRAQVRNFWSDNQNSVFDYSTNSYFLIPSVSAEYKFNDQVYAAYASFTGKAGKSGRLGYNAGLRAESSNYTGKLILTNQQFKVDFPISLFPSAFLSYKITDRSDWQFNYTRRINRPNFFQLMPFIDFTDPLNLQVGNAGLKPEFTNSLETNFSKQFNNNHTLLMSAYFKYTEGLLTRYQYKGLNQVSKDSAIYNSWINANSARTYGFEVTSTNKFSKKFEATTNLNFYNAAINSENIQQNLNNSQTSFFGKMTLTFRMGKSNNWTLQANGDYQSKTVLPAGGGGGRGWGGGGGMMGGGFFGGTQAAGSNGFVNPNYGMDLSIRRDIIKNKNGQGYAGSLTLSMNDIFRTRIYDVTTSSDFFLQNLTRRRDPQVLRLQFNWRFGKLDTSLFKRKNMKGEMEGMSEGMNMQ